MLQETLEKVRRRWEIEDLSPNPPLDDATLRRRLEGLGATPTGEVLEVYSTLNGFEDCRMDSECFAFWSIDQMIEENVLSGRVRNKAYIHFADFLIFSHTYAFRQMSDDLVNVYCHYDDKHVIKVANSFEEFFGYYLLTDKKLWPDLE